MLHVWIAEARKKHMARRSQEVLPGHDATIQSESIFDPEEEIAAPPCEHDQAFLLRLRLTALQQEISAEGMTTADKHSPKAKRVIAADPNDPYYDVY